MFKADFTVFKVFLGQIVKKTKDLCSVKPHTIYKAGVVIRNFLPLFDFTTLFPCEV